MDVTTWPIFSVYRDLTLLFWARYIASGARGPHLLFAVVAVVLGCGTLVILRGLLILVLVYSGLVGGHVGMPSTFGI